MTCDWGEGSFQHDSNPNILPTQHCIGFRQGCPYIALDKSLSLKATQRPERFLGLHNRTLNSKTLFDFALYTDG